MMKVTFLLFCVVSMCMSGCASKDQLVANEEAAVVARAVEDFEGEYVVTKKRATALIPSVRGEDNWTTGREMILHKGDTLRVTSIIGVRAHATLTDGRQAYVFLDDVTPMAPDVATLPVLAGQNSQHAYPVAPRRPPAPVDRELIEESNDVDLPEKEVPTPELEPEQEIPKPNPTDAPTLNISPFVEPADAGGA